MSLIEDIKRDREAGTHGPWLLDEDISNNGILSSDRLSYVALCIRDASGDTKESVGNARRIARVPEMEARILSDADRISALEEKSRLADQMAEAVELMMADLVEHGGYSFEDDFEREVYAIAAYREATK